MNLAWDIFLLLLLVGGIVIACEAFTNAIEWLGKLLKLNEGAVGSVLAAVGTALPETVIPIIAIVGAWLAGTSGGEAIGEGAIIGAPFMLSTLAMFVTGVAVVVFVRQGRRTEDMMVDATVLGRDLLTFLLTYAAAIAISFLPDWRIVGPLSLKALLGCGFIVIYALYVKRTLSAPGELGEDLGPLHFARNHATPPLGRVIWQISISLGAILVGAHLFVNRIEHLSHLLQVPALLLSLLITPIATELPEKLNSVIWVRVRKDTLALGNLTGAMVFQSCIPVAVGMWLTPWKLSAASIYSAVLALTASAIMIWYLRVRKKLTVYLLLICGGFYLLFLLGIFFVR
ncbi:MAG: sodium:calcium antiporter [Cyanobacteria bacterium NC_groundwater_1444_Ag_S-0.65um_54_12]|nr:sodium:calcium antiporter [Cyanobacteria bacterium NC_groundwater_1444_Ag_S-0.65um_54_12]